MIAELEAALEACRAERARLREALAFFADERHYQTDVGNAPSNEVAVHGLEIARYALAATPASPAAGEAE
jgi:hypothetical protein